MAGKPTGHSGTLEMIPLIWSLVPTKSMRAGSRVCLGAKGEKEVKSEMLLGSFILNSG